MVISSAGYSQESKESFEEFIKKFEDEAFQISSIKFPLEMTFIDQESFEESSKELAKEEWTYTHFYLNFLFNGEDAYPQIYDNFDRKLRDTDERVFSLIGFSDLNINYYFKRIEGKWYLIKIEDFSI